MMGKNTRLKSDDINEMLDRDNSNDRYKMDREIFKI